MFRIRFVFIVFCQKCGCLATDHMSKLAKPCEGLKTYGDRNLRALRNGMLPPNVKQWPDDVSHIRPELEVLGSLQGELDRLEPIMAANAQSHLAPDISDEEGSARSVLTADLFGSDFAKSDDESE